MNEQPSMKVKELIDKLRDFDPEAECWAYEGEVTGVIIGETKGQRGGYITNRGKVVKDG